MKMLRKSIAKLLQHSLSIYIEASVAILAAVLLLATKHLIDDSVTYTVIALIVLILGLLIRILALHSRVEKATINALETISHVTSISTMYIPNPDGLDPAYLKSLEIISLATKRIWIIADYSPEDEPLRNSPTRNRYYKAIEDKLEERKAAGEGAFEYKRIMQRNKTICAHIGEEKKKRGAVIKKKGILDRSEYIKGDEPAFLHCKRVLDKFPIDAQDNIEVYIAVTPFVPSLPSILMVDDKHLMFTIPKRKQGDTLLTAGAFHFIENRTHREMIPNFEEIFNTVLNDNSTTAITRIDSESFAEFKPVNAKRFGRTKR